MADMDAAAATMIANLEKATGKRFADWLKTAAKAPEQKHGKIVAFLKAEHGLAHGYANLVAMKALKADAGSIDDDKLVADMFAGDKAGLRPIYDALIAAVDKIGTDYEKAPKKGYMSLRRSKQFATLRPSTAARFDLGLALKGEPTSARLEAAGSWNAMVSHRVRLAAPKDVDAKVKGWLKAAYERAGTPKG